ncbi:hypothetical protein [Psychromicrobium xiongbiense]|uniref:hypothetical protein n=1 Tax=Psychromicrobium xiongbiense TaxID=3051184 RepID=UPI002556CD75|nr:hypothetical protein [Psychromicrobium sp. YIM S02556]
MDEVSDVIRRYEERTGEKVSPRKARRWAAKASREASRRDLQRARSRQVKASDGIWYFISAGKWGYEPTPPDGPLEPGMYVDGGTVLLEGLTRALVAAAAWIFRRSFRAPYGVKIWREHTSGPRWECLVHEGLEEQSALAPRVNELEKLILDGNKPWIGADRPGTI